MLADTSYAQDLKDKDSSARCSSYGLKILEREQIMLECVQMKKLIYINRLRHCKGCTRASQLLLTSSNKLPIA